MTLLWKLLRSHLSVAQTVGFALAGVVGMTIVLTSVQAYRDVMPVFDAPDSFMRGDYLVLSKQVGALQAIGLGSSDFTAEELADLDALGAEFGPTPLVISSLATAEDTSALINIVAKFCISRENFHQKYEAAIMDMIQCAFIRSEKEVVDGYILSDGEIVERLQSLSHMKEIDYWQIVGSVWAASTMSRPILERYGQNVPLLARQILIPVLAVGLCYGIETDVVQMVAQYIIRLLTARGELDSVLRAAFCHHPENYISLMEYYAPEEHGMEPFTRK